ncbi:MAG TPA: LytTR family DNA-binding domain-containing protein [Gemmatimonadaceae bacterium]|nr:LytTR family DNA-binding domain-containing protein [Gemmatimonadaceae bacterium]
MMRVLIVDDEPLARRRMRRMLATEPGIEVVGECGNGADAIAKVAELAPDVVLLDIEMPGGDGFDVLGSPSLSDAPLVIFVTAHDEYALRAFEAAAVDYLLKPVRRARLRVALDRARERLTHETPVIDQARDLEVQEAVLPSAHLLIERGNHMDVVRVDEIDWIEASDNYVIVHVRGERHRYRRTMDQVLERLPADRFARVHRSAIVNLDRVRQVHPWFHGSSLLVLADGSRVATGRQYRGAVMGRLHLLR